MAADKVEVIHEDSRGIAPAVMKEKLKLSSGIS
jgi:hypothetical protein